MLKFMRYTKEVVSIQYKGGGLKQACLCCIGIPLSWSGYKANFKLWSIFN